MGFTFDGLEELKAALRQMPEHLTGEATGIVTRRANKARAEIDANYPVGPDEGGHLKGKTAVTVTASRHGVIARIRNNGKTALSFEYGTQIRRDSRGRNRGAAPPGNVFKPVVERERDAMNDELAAMLVKEGFEVSGR